MLKYCILVAGITLCNGTLALAQAPAPIQQHNTNMLWFENWTGLSDAMLRVASPDGQVETIRQASGTPVYHLSGTTVADGIYRYELRASPEIRSRYGSGNATQYTANASETPTKIFYRSGAFLVQGGAIVTPETTTETRTSD